MTTREVHTHLTFDPAERRTIEVALEALIQKMDAHTLFQYGNLTLQVSDGLGRPPKLHEAILSPLLGHLHQEVESAPDGGHTSVNGIFALFTHAMADVSLSPVVERTIDALIRYSRHVNDSGEMWVDNSSVFGVDIMYAFAYHRPEALYKFALYAIPYWDMEHADYITDYFHTLRNRLLDIGDTHSLLKAIVHADNHEIRLCLLNLTEDLEWPPFDFVETFRASEAAYTTFKNLLIERFKEHPFLHYTARTRTEYPIHALYSDFAQLHRRASNPETDDIDFYDDEANLDMHFVVDTFDNEAENMHQLLDDLYGSIVSPSAEDSESAPEDGELRYSDWKAFFLKVFDEGEAVWEYILTGKNSELLERLQPFDLMSRVRGSGLSVEKHFNYFYSEIEPLSYCLVDIFLDFFSYFEAPEMSNPQLKIAVNGVSTDENACVLRTMDVLNTTFEGVFSNWIYKDFLDTERLSSPAFRARYDLFTDHYTRDVNALLQTAMDDMFPVDLRLLKRLYAFMALDSAQSRPILKSKWTPTAAALTLSAFVYERDAALGKSDSELAYLVKSNWLSVVTEAIGAETQGIEEALEAFVSYVKGPSKPPKALIMKLMTQGPDALTPEENATLKASRPSGPSLEAVAGGFGEASQTLVSAVEDLLSPLFSLYKWADHEWTSELTRFFKFCFACAPFQTILAIKAPYVDSYDDVSDAVNTEYDVDDALKKLFKAPHLIKAAELHLAFENGNYAPYVEAYADDEPGFMGMPSRRAQIEAALEYIEGRKVDRFKDLVGLRPVEDLTVTSDFEKALDKAVAQALVRERDYLESLESVEHLDYDTFRAHHALEVLAADIEWTFSSKALEKLNKRYERPTPFVFLRSSDGTLRLVSGRKQFKFLVTHVDDAVRSFWQHQSDFYIVDVEATSNADRHWLQLNQNERTRLIRDSFAHYIHTGESDAFMGLTHLLPHWKSHLLDPYYVHTTDEKRLRFVNAHYWLGAEKLTDLEYIDPLGAEQLMRDLVRLKLPKSVSIACAVKSRDSDCFQILFESGDYTAAVMDLPTSEQLLVIEMADETSEWRHLLRALATSSVLRVQKAAKKALRT